MKRVKTGLIFALITVSVMLSFMLFCAGYAEEEYIFEVKDGNAYITGYLGSDSVLYVPDMINGFPVVSVSLANAQNKRLITKVVLPSSVTELGDQAFMSFCSLREIVGLNHIKRLGEESLYNTGLLEYVFSEELDTIEKRSFGCSLAERLVIPDDVEFEEGFMNDMMYLSDLELLVSGNPPKLALHNHSLFSADMKRLVYVLPSYIRMDYVIPAGVESIDQNAIENCNIANVYIPSTVKDMEHYSIALNVNMHVYFETGNPIAEEWIKNHKGELDYYSGLVIEIVDDPADTVIENIIGNLVTQARTETNSDYDCALYLHDWIINNVEYDFHNATGLYDLFYNGIAVCEGYTKGYAALLTEAGIPNKTVALWTNMIPHAANIVYLNGKWSFVDATWNDNGDQSENEKYWINSHTYFGYNDTIRKHASQRIVTESNFDILSISKTPSTSIKSHAWYVYGHMDYALDQLVTAVNMHLDQSETTFTINYEQSWNQSSLPSPYFEYALADLATEILKDNSDVNIIISFNYDYFVCNIQSYTDDIPYEYTVSNDLVSIIGYTGKEERVDIPDTIAGYPVASIERCAFLGNYTVKSIHLPDSIISIGEQAFAECILLEEINLPCKLERIGTESFVKCYSLCSDIIIPVTVQYIGEQAFEGCCSIASLTITGNPQVGSWAFMNCTNLTQVDLGDSLEILSVCMFKNDGKIENLRLPNLLKAIRSSAFSGLSSLKSLHIPASVLYIEGNPAHCCRQLEVLTVDINNPEYCSINNLLYDKEQLNLQGSAANGLDDILVLPSSTERICIGSLDGAQIDILVIPEDVVAIDDMILSESTVRTVFFGRGVKTVGWEPYMGADELISIYGYQWTPRDYMYSNRKFIDIEEMIALFSQTQLEVLEGDQIDLIPKDWPEDICTVLSWSSSLDSVASVDNGVMTAFDNGIAKVSAMLGDRALVECTVIVHGEDKIVLPESLIEIAEEAFRGSGVKEVFVGSDVTRICSKAFYDCQSLRLIVLPNGIAEIADDAFLNCASLTIICSEGSYGQAFALAKGIPYVISTR